MKAGILMIINFVADHMDSILLQRGCSHHCGHCGADSERKITTMSWKNFEAIANGMGELKERLGFNPFRLGDNAYSENVIYPFIDSDPMLFKSSTGLTDEKGNPVYRDIHDAARLFYEKTGTKFSLTTAGWSPKNKFAQRAAEKIVNDSECISDITISLHPFHRYFEEAREFERKADMEKDEDKKNILLEKAEGKRNKYYEMMANTIYTFLPLVKNGKPNILFMNFPEGLDDKYQIQDMETNMGNKIYKKLEKKVIEEEGEDSLKEKDEDIKNIEVYNREIGYMGRAYNFAPLDTKLGETRIKDDRYYQTLYEESKVIVYTKSKRIDLDGSILLNYISHFHLGNVRFYPVKLVGKKLNLPEPQEIKTERTVPEYPWPDENFLDLNKRYG